MFKKLRKVETCEIALPAEVISRAEPLEEDDFWWLKLFRMPGWDYLCKCFIGIPIVIHTKAYMSNQFHSSSYLYVWQVPCLRVRVSQHEKPGDHRLCRRLKMTNSVRHLGSPLLTHPAPRRGPPREARAPFLWWVVSLGVTGPIAGHQPWFLVNVVSNTWSDTQHSAVQNLPTCNMLWRWVWEKPPTETHQPPILWWLALWCFEVKDLWRLNSPWKVRGFFRPFDLSGTQPASGWRATGSSRGNPDIVWDHISIGTVNHFWIWEKWLGGKRGKKGQIKKATRFLTTKLPNIGRSPLHFWGMMKINTPGWQVSNSWYPSMQ